MSDTSAAFVAFTNSARTLTAFQQAFTAAFGVEPDIIGDVIWSPQCPALDFLRHTRSLKRPPMIMEMAEVNVQADQPAAGAIHASPCAAR